MMQNEPIDCMVFFRQLQKNASRYPQDQWITEMFVPEFKTEEYLETGNLLSELFDNLLLQRLDLMGHGFYTNYEEDEDYVYIGAIDTDQISIDKETGEILLISEDGVLIYYLADSLSGYLQMLILFAEYAIKGFFGYRFSQSDRRDMRKKCKQQIQNPKYFRYYEVTFGD